MSLNHSTLEPPARPAEERVQTSRDLWRRYSKSGPGSAPENSLVEQYLPLVKTVVGRLAMTLPSHVNTDDLYSAGLVGLLNAVRRFNPKGGSSFETYARVRIRGAVFDELRRLDWVPRSVHDKAKKVEQTMHELAQRNGGIPDRRRNGQGHGPVRWTNTRNCSRKSAPPPTSAWIRVAGRRRRHRRDSHDIVADDSQGNPGEGDRACGKWRG